MWSHWWDRSWRRRGRSSASSWRRRGGLILAFIFLSSAIKVVTEYERAVFFRLGHVRPEAKGPGVILRFPVVDRLVKVNLRVEVVDIPAQAVITKDNVTIQVDAVVYFQVVDPVQAIIGVDNFRFASQRVAMTSLRSIIGRFELDDLLAHREEVNTELRTVIAAVDRDTGGCVVRQVEVRDITLPPELLRAMARQAEAERERRAKVIAATGELEASKELAEAAAKLYESPGPCSCAALQTLAEVATRAQLDPDLPDPDRAADGVHHPRPRRGRLGASRGRHPPRPAAAPAPVGRRRLGRIGDLPAAPGDPGAGRRPRTCGVRSPRRRRRRAPGSPRRRPAPWPPWRHGTSRRRRPARRRTAPACERRGARRCGRRPRPRWPRGRPGHLHHGQERVEPAELPEHDGHADHGQRGDGGQHAGQVRGHAGPGDEDPEPPPVGITGELQGVVGGAVGREHADLDRYAELAQRLDGAVHHRPHRTRFPSLRQPSSSDSCPLWSIVPARVAVAPPSFCSAQRAAHIRPTARRRRAEIDQPEAGTRWSTACRVPGRASTPTAAMSRS